MADALLDPIRDFIDGGAIVSSQAYQAVHQILLIIIGFRGTTPCRANEHKPISSYWGMLYMMAAPTQFPLTDEALIPSNRVVYAEHVLYVMERARWHHFSILGYRSPMALFQSKPCQLAVP